MNEPLLYESHMHTPLCRHAEGEPEEYAAHAQQRNLKGIIVTCHGPTPFEWWHCISQSDWPKYVQMVRRAREKWAGQIDVRLGIECDYMPELENWWREFLHDAPLNHVLGSVHPQVGEYRERYFTGDEFAYQQTYFEHLAQAAESRLFDTLSHPDLVKNIAPDEWNLERILPHIERALDRIAATGIAMELNTSGVQKAIPEMNPGLTMLRAMQKRGIPVVIGADAHIPQRVADGYETALDILQSAGYSEVHYFLNRKRHSVKIDDARASLCGG
jgi:histidinol-phosphatase (PHP family)